MAEEVLIKLAPKIKKELAREAAEAGLSTEKLIALLMEGFVEGDGKVFTAPWSEGPGIRLLPDWPRFSSKVVKVKREEMK